MARDIQSSTPEQSVETTSQDRAGSSALQRQPGRHSTMRRLWRSIRRNWAAQLSLIIIAILAIMVVFAPWIAPYEPQAQNMLARFESPSRDHLLGTDELGRDILSRIIHGSRISVTIGIASVLLGLGVGVAFGLLGGYFGGRLDYALVGLNDVLLAFPGVLLAILIISVLGSGILNLVIAISIWSVPAYARITRGSVLSLKRQEFVEAARTIGAGHPRIMFRYLLGNCLSPIIVYSTLRLATTILTVAALGFLGIGISPPTPEWGSMVATGREYIRSASHLIYMPGLAIFFTVMAFNLLGDTLQDALDPRGAGREPMS